MTEFIAALLPASYIPPGPEQPPGTEGVATIVAWVLWGAGAILFCYFVYGVVTAARARRAGGDVDVEAPAWPLVAAIVLGAAGTIWNVVSG